MEAELSNQNKSPDTKSSTFSQWAQVTGAIIDFFTVEYVDNEYDPSNLRQICDLLQLFSNGWLTWLILFFPGEK